MSENANEYKGSTVDEAVEIGLKEMNLTESDVDIEVVSHGGLFKKAKVLIKTKEEKKAEETKSAEEVVNVEKAEIVVRILSSEELIEYSQKAESYAKTILNLMNVECDVAVKIDSEGIDIAITGKDANKVIGYRGETIDAIQYLILVFINKDRKENEFVRVSIDADDYRVKREQILTSLAHKLAKKVVDYKKPAKLEPMNPFERRIIHSALQDNELVKTESFGDGKDRYVVILLKDATYRPSNFNRGNDDRGNFNRDRKFDGNRERRYDNNRGDGQRREYDPNRPKREYDPNRPKREYDPNRPKREFDPNRPQREYDPNRPKREFDPNRPKREYDPNRPQREFDPNRPKREYDPNRPKREFDPNRSDRPRRDFDPNRSGARRDNDGYQKKFESIDNNFEKKDEVENNDDNNFSSDFKKTGPSKLKSFGYNKRRF